MTVFTYTNNGTSVAGMIILEEVSGDSQFSVREAIAADIESYIPEEYAIPFSVAAWGVSVDIDEFDTDAIRSVVGIPARRRFGTITYYSVLSFMEVQYFSYLRQAFRQQRCLVYPNGYNDLPFRNADIQPLTAVDGLSTSTGVVSSLGLYQGYDTFVGATGFTYNFEPSVVASICVPYYVRNIDASSGEGSSAGFLNY